MFIEVTEFGGRKTTINTDHIVSFNGMVGVTGSQIIFMGKTSISVEETYDELKHMICNYVNDTFDDKGHLVELPKIQEYEIINE